MAMTTTTDIPSAEWHSHVLATERRNGPVELCPDPESYDTDFCQTNIHKVRLLYIQDGQWFVERPFSMDGQPAITRGMHLLGILGSGALRWSFRTTVDAAVKFQLNSTKRVPALRLSPPYDVKSAQRRAFFRIGLLGSAVPDVTCWPLLDLAGVIDCESANEYLHREGELPSPRPLPPATDTCFTAILHDLSGNGLSFIADDPTMHRLEENPLLWIKLELTGLPHPLMMVARYIRHQLDDHGRHIVGTAFQYQHHRAHEPFICDHICKWAAAEQRRQLHRTR